MSLTHCPICKEPWEQHRHCSENMPIHPAHQTKREGMSIEDYRRDYETWRPEFLPPCVENYIAALEVECERLKSGAWHNAPTCSGWWRSGVTERWNYWVLPINVNDRWVKLASPWWGPWNPPSLKDND